MIEAFTICSANYLHYAEVLGESLAKSNPDLSFTVFLADALPEDLEPHFLLFDIVPVAELEVPFLYDMAARYGIMEFNTAVKPFCFQWLFKHRNADGVIYLDPDILGVSPFVELVALLRGPADIILTPHTLTPFPDDHRHPDDTQMMRAGTFNLGFLALRRSSEAERFLNWWGEHLKQDCLVKTEEGIFVDQKFCDLAPCFFNNVHLLKHIGYNVAYWNLHERRVAQGSDGWCVNESAPLRFFHFSGVDPENDKKLSKHQNRFEISDLGELSVLTTEYCASVRRSKAMLPAIVTQAKYHYGRLVDGTAITDHMRHVYRSVQPSAPRAYEEAFSPDLGPYLLADYDLAVSGIMVPRLLYHIWSRRKDLQLAFPLGSAGGAERFLKWFEETVGREYKMPDRVVEALIEAARARPVDDGAGWPTLMAADLRHRKDERHKSVVARGFGEDAPGLDYYGYFRAATGVGMAATKLAQALALNGVPLTCHEIPGTPLDIPDPVGLTFDAPRRRAALFHMNADMTSLFETCMDPRLMTRSHRIGYWAWELDTLPLQWRRAFDFVDEIWTPSSFVARAVGERTEKPVHVVPHPVTAPDETPDPAKCRERFGISADKLVVLVAFDANSYVSRKNPLGAVRAFNKAFSGWKEAPQLVVKFHGRYPAVERAALERELAKAADAILITRVLTDEETSDLQWACDIFLSLHRAEGFGLWIAECMARSKACVVTNYSGNADFTDATNSVPIRFVMTEVREGEYPMGAGRLWAEPDIDHAAESLKMLAEDPEWRRALGAAARQAIVTKLSPQRIGALAKRRLYQACAESFFLPALAVGGAERKST